MQLESKYYEFRTTSAPVGQEVKPPTAEDRWGFVSMDVVDKTTVVVLWAKEKPKK